MNIVVMGQSKVAIEFTKLFLEKGFKIPCVVVSRRENHWQPLFKEYAEDVGIPVVELQDVPKVDYIFCVQFSEILDKETIDKGLCINLHYALLPANRGGSPFYWAVLNGDRMTGITWHYIDEGVDKGDLIYQRCFPITEEDTSWTVYNKCENLALDTFPAICEMAGKYSFPRYKQGDGGSYHSRKDVDFNQRRVSVNEPNAIKKIRALIFPPYQLPEVVE